MEQTLGKRIMEHRKRLGLTQDALAEKLGITAQAVSKWENDVSCPDINMLPRLAELFGISTDELLGRPAQGKVHEAEVVDDEDDGGVINFTLGKDESDGKWSFHWDSGRKSAVTFAVWVLLVGILSVLNRYFAWGAGFWSILWPTCLLVYGLAGCLRRFSLFNFGIGILGGYFTVQNLGLWELNIAGELIFPICIVLFGIGLLFDALHKPKKPHFSITKRGGNSKKTRSDCRNGADSFSCDLAFGENTHYVQLPVLSGGEADVSFGQLTVDLTGCEAVSDDCHISADCSFGELRLRVPRRFAVRAESDTTFASVSFSGQPDSEPVGIIYLDADASFGNILIKYI